MVGLIGLKSGGISNTPFKLATIGATRRKKIQTKIKANFYFYFSARQVPVITLRKCYRFSLSLSLSLSLGPNLSWHNLSFKVQVGSQGRNGRIFGFSRYFVIQEPFLTLFKIVIEKLYIIDYLTQLNATENFLKKSIFLNR